MTGLITEISDSIKDYWPPKAVDTLLQENIVFRPKLIRGLPPGARISDGYEIRFAARLEPSQNTSQIADGGNFPIQKDATDRKFTFKTTVFAGSYVVGGLTRYVANSNKASFNGGEMKRRPQEVMSNLGKNIEMTYVGTTGNGIRGYVESEPAANQIKIKQPYGTRLLRPNMYVSERIAAASTVRDTIDLRQLTDVDDDNRTVTYSGADQTPVADDPIYVVPESALAGATLGSMHANGLRGQVGNSDDLLLFHALDRTAAGNRKLNSVVDENGGERRNVSEQLLIRVAHKTARLSEKRPSTLIMGEGQIEKYIEHVAPQKRFPAQGRQRPGKSTGYVISELNFATPYGEMEFMLSFDCLPGEIRGVSWDCFFFYSALDAQWMSGDEATLHLLPGSNGATHKFAWGAYLISIENWGTDYAIAHFVIKDLKDPLLGD